MTLTVREYLSHGWRDRLRYRLYRDPLVMFGVGPIYLFLIENRLPLIVVATAIRSRRPSG